MFDSIFEDLVNVVTGIFGDTDPTPTAPAPVHFGESSSISSYPTTDGGTTSWSTGNPGSGYVDANGHEVPKSHIAYPSA